MKDIIQAMLDGGWLKEKGILTRVPMTNDPFTRPFTLSFYNGKLIEHYHFSLSDIITDPSAIGALVGEGSYCEWADKAGYVDTKCTPDMQNHCYESQTGIKSEECRWYRGDIAVYHMHQLIQICGENKDPSQRREKVVGYLRGLVK